MSMSDPIADFLTRIRNGLHAKKRWVDVPSSIMKKRISLVLKEEKFIQDFFFISNDKGFVSCLVTYIKNLFFKPLAVDIITSSADTLAILRAF